MYSCKQVATVPFLLNFSSMFSYLAVSLLPCFSLPRYICICYPCLLCSENVVSCSYHTVGNFWNEKILGQFGNCLSFQSLQCNFIIILPSVYHECVISYLLYCIKSCQENTYVHESLFGKCPTAVSPCTSIIMYWMIW